MRDNGPGLNGGLGFVPWMVVDIKEARHKRVGCTMFRHAIRTGLLLALVASVCIAADEAEKTDEAKKTPAAAKKTEPAAPQGDQLQATVVSVKGRAQKRDASEANSKWTPLKAGDKLGAMTLVRTGLGTKVVLNLAGRGEVTLGSGTKVGIGQFAKRGQTVQTRLGLKYGSMRASVDRTRGPTRFQVTTAQATASVRGTKGGMANGQWGTVLHGTQNSWKWVSHGSGWKAIVFAGEWKDNSRTPWYLDLLRRRDTHSTAGFFGQPPEDAIPRRLNGTGRGGFNGVPTHGGRRQVKPFFVDPNPRPQRVVPWTPPWRPKPIVRPWVPKTITSRQPCHDCPPPEPNNHVVDKPGYDKK